MKDGVKKYRLILDCRVSGSNDAARRVERVLLPKCWDIIRDIMALKKVCGDSEEVLLFVLDFKDAFYMLPLLDRERQYFSAYHDGAWYVWERVAQGSVNGPNAFGRLSALVGRLSQSLFGDSEARINIYTDDPCTVLRGSRREIRSNITMLTLLWRVLGWSLSYHKGQWGKVVDWIGFHLAITPSSVEATIKEGFMNDYRKMVGDL